jgi:histidinol-phosphate aminotransferase
VNELRLSQQLLKVPLYVAGKSAEEVREELGLDEVLKMASNENPLGPSPMAVKALMESAQEANRYPGIAERELRRRLASFHGPDFTERHFIIGNGGTDVLRMVTQAFLFDGGESISGRLTFPVYGLLTTMFGGTSIPVEPTSDLGLDLTAMSEAVTPSTRVVWLCSPNNPTGAVLSQDEVDAFLDRLPDHLVVVLDQSYSDFVTDQTAVDGTRYVLQGRSVAVVRSFSKSAGLANLRVGYGIAHPDLIEYLLHTVLPFNTGATVIQAAIASLDDQQFRQQSRELIARERTFLVRGMQELGLNCLPSQANFVLASEVPGGADLLAEKLLQDGIIVRPMAAFGAPNSIRVSLGLREQNQQLLEALASILERTRS